MGEIDGREHIFEARASAQLADEARAVDESFNVSPRDLIVLARIASKAKLARDCMHDRDERIAEAVQDEGIEVAAVARAAELSPAEVASIVFAQEANPSPFTRLRRTVRTGHAPATVAD